MVCGAWQDRSFKASWAGYGWLAIQCALLCLALMPWTSAHAQGAAPVQGWRFAPERDYGPFVFADERGDVQGLSVDVLRMVAASQGLAIQTLRPGDLQQNLDAVLRGEVDLVSSLRETPERSAYLLFTHPYVTVPAVFVGLPGQVKRLSELTGKAVAVGQGYAVEGHVRRRWPGVDWRAVPNDAEALKQLASGTVVGVVIDSASLAHLQQRQDGPMVEVGEPVGFQYSLSFAVRRDLPQLREALDQGLKGLTDDQRAQLHSRWLGLKESQGLHTERFLWAGLLALVFGVLGLAVLAWRRFQAERTAAAGEGHST